MGEGLHVDAAKARTLLREILTSGTLTYSGHAKREMEKDKLTTQDLVNVLRAGVVEPSEFENGSWRHRVKTNAICVVVVLVSAVHNATVRSIRYARSLRPDELHCIHVAVDGKETEEVVADWKRWGLPHDLEVLDSPYRQIAGPIHEWIRSLVEEHPRTFVTIVLPEFVVSKFWHSMLHNQTALTLKGTFLFEPSVVVSSVPYELRR